MTTYGTPAQVDARSALEAEIQRTAGVVAWLGEQVGRLDPDALVKGTKFVRTTTNAAGEKITVAEAGSARHELLALFIEERRHLHALCRDALAVESRTVAKNGAWPRAN